MSDEAPDQPASITSSFTARTDEALAVYQRRLSRSLGREVSPEGALAHLVESHPSSRAEWKPY